jgi:amino acid adenylation domain-containing protein
MPVSSLKTCTTVESTYPLSPLQAGMLFYSLSNSSSGFYIQQTLCRLQEKLDFPNWERAWQKIVERHPILRTSFHWQGDGNPVQLVHETAVLRMEKQDLRGKPESEQQQLLQSALKEDKYTDFDFSVPPLMRVKLFQLAEEDYFFLWTFHHCILDGRSRTSILQEVFCLYQGYCEGVEPSLPLPRPFFDYIAWLQKLDIAPARDYWRGILETFRSPISFTAVSRNKNRAESETCGEVVLQLPAELKERGEAVARENRVTLNAFLQAAWALLLGRYYAEQDIVFGAIWACRSGLPGIESMVGLVINTLPIRLRLDPQMPVIDFVRMVRQQHLGLREHVHTPLDQIESWSGVPAGARLFESIVVFDDMELNHALHLGQGEAWKKREFQRLGDPHYPLTLLAIRKPGFRLVIIFHQSIFSRAQAEQMTAHLQMLLEACILNPGQRLGELPALTGPERQQLAKLNRTAATFRENCVHEFFEEQAAARPDAFAVVSERQSLTYEELNRRSNQLARYLRERGVGPETLVGLCLERSLETVVGLLAILKAGGAYVPLDIAFPAERLRYILEDARIRLVLTQGHLRGKIPACGESIAIDEDQALWEQYPSSNLGGTVQPANPVYVIYTSGSTGKPKGIVVEHRQLANYLQAVSAFLRLKPGLRMAMVSTFGSDLGNTMLFPSLCGGGELHVVSDEVVRNPRAWAQYCQSYAIECIKVTPAHLESLLNLNQEQSYQGRPARSGVPSRLVVLGGEASNREWIEKVRKSGGELCEIVNHYGPTECTVGSLADWVYGPVGSSGNNVPIGRPLDNVRVYVVDKNGLLAVPGQPGELWIGGAGVARGYLGKAGLTAERFVPDAFSGRSGERLYRTGDLVQMLPEGKIEFLGRIDFQLKIRGFRVELEEIEAALHEHDAVSAAVAVAWGPAGQKRIAAYVVAKNTTSRELRDFLKTRLPDYMMPSSLMLLERLPLTPNGKIDRQALPSPEIEQQLSYSEPVTPVEEVLAVIWAEALKLPRVGIHDHFFELGGNSLLAMRTLWQMQEALQTEISLRQFVQNPTIAALAHSLIPALAQHHGKENLFLQPRADSAPAPLSFGQERLWFLQQFDLSSTVYNTSHLFWLKGSLDASALEKALREIMRRHEALRTTFSLAENEPVQVIHPEPDLFFQQTRLEAVPEHGREREARALANRQACEPFDLVRGPLVRFQLVRLGPEQNALVFSAHHIVSDGWSTDILLQELAALYAAFSKGEAISLPELPVQYVDFADWQRRFAQGDAFREQLEYWKQQLQGMPESLELSVARPRPPAPSSAGARHCFQIPPQISDALSAMSRKEGVTLFMTLLSAFHVLLGRYSGSQDIVVGTPIAGRSHAETEKLIGFFVNMLVLRTKLADDLRFRDLLHRVRAMALQAYVNQDVPFDKLVQELRPERRSSRVPLVQVVFTLEAKQRDRTLGELALHAEEFTNGTAKFDLVLSVTETSRGLHGWFDYSLDLFDASTIERMTAHWIALLEAAAGAPQRMITDLEWLSSGEREQLIDGWNNTRAGYAENWCVHELFEAQAEKTPKAAALLFGEQQLSYKELDQQADQLAHHLQKLGVGPEVPVAICMGRSPELVIAMLAVLKAGGAYVPLDPSYPSQHLAFTVKDSGTPVLLTQRQWSGKLPQNGIQVICLDQFRPAAGEKLRRQVSPDNLAYVIYTSGSTGRPKGVSVTHRNLLNLVFWHQSAFQITATDRATQLASPAFDASTWELWPYLASGAAVTIIDDKTRMDPEELQKFILSQAVTVSFAPTPVAEELLRLAWPAKIPLRLLLAGGDRLRKLPRRGLPFMLVNNYGPTENTVVATSGVVDPLENEQGDPSIGRPIANVKAYVLDRQYRPVPVGIPGELYLSGKNLSRGYLNQPRLTAERFLSDPFSAETGERMYATGDLVRYGADGRLEFLDRIDQQVKVRGFRIELGEIEKVLAGHPMVRDAVVIADGNSTADRRLAAYIVANEPQEPSAEELRDFVAARLPDHMVPAYFVKLARLPLTPNQKIDRAALPPPEKQVNSTRKTYVPPQTAIEEFLVGIWARILKVEHVGAQDDFFELGGHSLLAVQVLSRIRSILKVDLPLQKLFEAPTVKELATAVLSSAKDQGRTEKIAMIYKQSLQAAPDGEKRKP